MDMPNYVTLDQVRLLLLYQPPCCVTASLSRLLVLTATLNSGVPQTIVTEGGVGISLGFYENHVSGHPGYN